MHKSRFLLATLAVASSAAFAGTVEVRFVDPASFFDAGTNRSDEPHNLDRIARHLQQLGTRLPADQVLRIEVLDVDLAGNVREAPRRGGRQRIVSDRADAPRFHLHYQLESNGRVLRSGDENVTDVGYRSGLVSNRTFSELYYEKRLLDEWFARNFLAQTHASR